MSGVRDIVLGLHGVGRPPRARGITGSPQVCAVEQPFLNAMGLGVESKLVLLVHGIQHRCRQFSHILSELEDPPKAGDEARLVVVYGPLK